LGKKILSGLAKHYDVSLKVKPRTSECPSLLQAFVYILMIVELDCSRMW
jgi:hypothetical protein